MHKVSYISFVLSVLSNYLLYSFWYIQNYYGTLKIQARCNDVACTILYTDAKDMDMGTLKLMDSLKFNIPR